MPFRLNAEDLQAQVDRLDALGSPDRIAEFLSARGIVGDRGRACHCPVAMWIGRVFGIDPAGSIESREFVAVGGGVSACNGDEQGVVYADMRGMVSQFTSRFDCGEYPFLESVHQ